VTKGVEISGGGEATEKRPKNR